MAMPPPYQPSPAAGLDVGAAFTYGWEKFKQNAGPMIILTLLVWAASAVVNLVGNSFDSNLMRAVFSIIGFVVAQVMTRGLVRAALVVVNGGRPEPGAVFGFENIAPFVVGAIIYGLVVGVGLLLCIIPGLVLGAMLAFWSFACVEQNLGAVDALKRSWELTKPHVGKVIVFGIAYFVVNLIGLILCAVGLLVTIPVSYIATAHAYRQLSGSVVAP